jgi:hypothetical protein
LTDRNTPPEPQQSTAQPEQEQPEVKPKKRKQIQPVDELMKYLRSCDKELKPEQLLNVREMESGTKRSKSYWSKKLNNIIFLTEMYKKCESAADNAQVEQSKEYWVNIALWFEDKAKGIGQRKYDSKNASASDLSTM